jgi:hypothetical protein
MESAKMLYFAYADWGGASDSGTTRPFPLPFWNRDFVIFDVIQPNCARATA